MKNCLRVPGQSPVAAQSRCFVLGAKHTRSVTSAERSERRDLIRFFGILSVTRRVLFVKVHASALMGAVKVSSSGFA